MAKTCFSIMSLILIFHIITTTAVAGRDIPNTNIKKHDGVSVKHPESFLKHDRGYLIPGIGRGIKPKLKDGYNPFTYNPVTGGNDGGIVSRHGTVFGRNGGGRSYMPGGDDTFVPNPGFEVPIRGSGRGTTPSPTGH